MSLAYLLVLVAEIREGEKMTENLDSIAVIIPVYQTEPYINHCIQSVCAQTFTALHIILVDDGSTDYSGTACDDWAKRDSRIDVIHKENGGPTSAVQAGFMLVREPYCAFVDSDDWVKPDLMERMLAQMKNQNVDGVRTGYTVYDEIHHEVRNDFVAKSRLYHHEEIEKEILEAFFDYNGDFASNWSNSRCSKLYKTNLLSQVIEQCNPMLRMGEDVELNLRYLPLCQQIYLDAGYGGYCIRVRRGSAQNRFSSELKHDYRAFTDVLRKVASEQNRQGLAINRMNAEFVRHLLLITAESKQSLSSKCDEVKSIWETVYDGEGVEGQFSDSGRIFRCCIRIQKEGHYWLGTLIMIIGITVYHGKTLVKRLYKKIARER